MANPLESVVNVKGLRDFYGRTIGNYVETIQRGERVRFRDPRLMDEEHRITKTVRAPHSSTDVKKARNHILTRRLFETMQRAEQLETGMIARISRQVQTPVITESLIYLGANQGIISTPIETFEENFSSLPIPQRDLCLYMRPITILELAIRDPDVVQRFDEKTPSFPHLLYRKPIERISMSEVELDIAQGVSDIISQGLIDLFPKVIPVFKDQVDFRRYNHYRRLGRYELPVIEHYNQMDFHFSEDIIDDPKRRAEEAECLDCLFDDAGLRREIFYTTMQYFNLCIEGTCSKGVRTKRLGKTRFKLKPTELKTCYEAMKQYAKNQLLGSFQKNEGGRANTSYLSRCLGLRSEVESLSRLSIYDPFNDSTMALRIDSLFLTTATRLPFLVHVLNRAYEGSQAVLAEQRD